MGPAALAGAARRTTARQLTRRSLADYPLAVCNDGSAATYHHSSDLASSRILINLQGGGWCGTEQSCKHRCQQSNVRTLQTGSIHLIPSTRTKL